MNDIVSVIVPIYKVEEYLDRCVNSIVNQTYKNLEIILVDDGSPDRCPQMCDEWKKKDSRIKVIHKLNEGAGLARNKGLENCTGKYICFFDSDDYLNPDTVEKCVKTAGKYSSDIVLFGAAEVDLNGNVLNNTDFDLGNTYFENEAVTENLLSELISHDFRKGREHNFHFSLWTGFFSSKLIKKNNLTFLSEREIFSEDSYFLLELYSKAKSVAVIPDVLYYHLINNGSLSQSYNEERHKRIGDFLIKTLELADSLNYSKEIKFRIYSLYHKQIIGLLKQILNANFKQRKCINLINAVLRDSIFMESLIKDVVIRENKLLQVFYLCANYRLYFLCYLMLVFKNS